MIHSTKFGTKGIE